MAREINPVCDFIFGSIHMITNRHGGCSIDHKNSEGHIHLPQRSHYRVHYFLSIEQKCNSLPFFKTENTSF